MRYDRNHRLFVSHYFAEDEHGVVVYDLDAETIDKDLTVYAQFMKRKKQLDHKTILSGMYVLRRFREFMVQRRLDFLNLHEKHLEQFRDEYYEVLLPTSRGKSKRTVMATINDYMFEIYRWLHWLKDQGRADFYLIGGETCRVKSMPQDRRRARNTRDSAGGSGTFTCPVAYKGTGASSKHKLPHFVPTEETRMELIEAFHGATDISYISQRNCLFQEIMNETGLRRESVNCLTVQQFDRAVIEAYEGEYMDVSPARQKFDYEDRFDFPVWLAVRVSDFIREYRQPLLIEKGWDESLCKGAIFLSYTKGTPITDRAMTMIFSRALRSLGAPVGAATHCFRHKFAHDEIETETEYRLSRGLDTSVGTIAATVSLRMGHVDPASLAPYVMSIHSRRRKK